MNPRYLLVQDNGEMETFETVEQVIEQIKEDMEYEPGLIPSNFSVYKLTPRKLSFNLVITE